MTVRSAIKLQPLTAWSTIVASGSEAISYLQGQLSFDMAQLGLDRMELATCNSPQGRVQAILWVIQHEADIVMLLPASMLDATLTRLKKYVLRSKVKLVPGEERFRVFGALDAHVGEPQTHRIVDGRSYVQIRGDSPRVLCLAAPGTESSGRDISADWHLADIRAGLPQVYPQTHEAFVAQMLNIDVLGGIGFEKGCYTGQEIIARTHFRGAIKRRMLRFRAEGAAPPPGTRVLADDQHAGDVVDAAVNDGGCELLAVVSLAKADAALTLDVPNKPALERLPLPYPL